MRVDRDENLRDDRRVGRLPASRAGKRVVYDAEHFFDGFRDDPDYAIACLRAALEAGAENVTLCDTNGASLPHEVAAARAASCARARRTPRWASTCHNDAECARGELARRRSPRAPRWSRAR